MSEHTPGPWVVGEFVQGHMAVCAGHRIVARITSSFYNARCDDDARLIAAAPDLHAALAEILRVDWERGTDWDTKTIMMSYLDAAKKMQAIAREAIAKANGAPP